MSLVTFSSVRKFLISPLFSSRVGINTPGQSGDPDSPHYRDLFELWARGQYFPLAYSRAKVESVRESTTRLAPSGTGTQQR